MSSVLQRLRKRRAYPVAIGDDTVHIRALTMGELDFADSLPEVDKVSFIIGCGLVNDAGEPDTPRLPNEALAEFAKRITPMTVELPMDTVVAILQAIDKASKPGKEDTLKKSS